MNELGDEREGALYLPASDRILAEKNPRRVSELEGFLGVLGAVRVNDVKRQFYELRFHGDVRPRTGRGRALVCSQLSNDSPRGLIH